MAIYGGLFDQIFSHYLHARIADSDAASSPWVLFLSVRRRWLRSSMLSPQPQ